MISPTSDRRAEMLAALAVIGARAGATEEGIRKAYRQACLTAHPDRGGEPVTFDSIQQAWRVIRETEALRTVCPACNGARFVSMQGPNFRRFKALCTACRGSGRNC
jgi:DnaJ-class molecular chaperone